MTRRRWAQTLAQAAVIAIAMAIGGLLAVNITGGDGGAATTPPPQPSPAQSSSTALQRTATSGSTAQQAAASSLSSLADIVQQATRSVVVITAVSGQRSGGEGSGIVVDTAGRIVTNYHVIEGGADLTVHFADGSASKARVVGTDQSNDLAVIQASSPPAQLYPATFANSDEVRVGDSVFAIGDPFAFKFSVTSGIVSGLGRQSESNSAGRAIRGVIQTDAAVNPGNSGGPLFNVQGQVIGVNTAIHNPTGQRVWVGIGLAIPSNTVTRSLSDLVAGRAIRHAQLGISGVTLDEVNAAQAGVAVTRGAYIASIVPGSAAERAGLRAPTASAAGATLPRGGDVVVAIDGVAVASMDDLARIIDGHQVGDQVTLTVVRGSDRFSIQATLLDWTG